MAFNGFFIGQEKLPKESWFLNENEYSEWVNRYRIPDQSVPTLPQGGSIRCLGEPRKVMVYKNLSIIDIYEVKIMFVC